MKPLPSIYIQCGNISYTPKSPSNAPCQKTANEAKHNVQNKTNQNKIKCKFSICPIVHAFTGQLIIDDNNFNLNEYIYNI